MKYLDALSIDVDQYLSWRRGVWALYKWPSIINKFIITIQYADLIFPVSEKLGDFQAFETI